MLMDLLEEVVRFYLASVDFNGISLETLQEKSGLAIEDLKAQLAVLLDRGEISINFGDRHPNSHIKAFHPESKEEQISKLEQLSRDPVPLDSCGECDTADDDEELQAYMEKWSLLISPLCHVCVYPERPALAG